MSNFHFADLLYNAIVWADFLGGLIVGICVMVLPILFYWPQKSEVADADQEVVAAADTFQSNTVS